MEKLIYQTIAHIEFLKKQVENSENNLQYITALQALKYSMDEFKSLLYKTPILRFEYRIPYLKYFYHENRFSFYDKVCNSILEYKKGNRPF